MNGGLKQINKIFNKYLEVINQYLPVTVFFFLISLVIVSRWIKPGLIIATAEDGLVLNNSYDSLDSSRSMWFGSDFGKPAPLAILRIGFLGLINFLSSLGFNLSIVQGFIFFITIFTGLIGMYLLTKLLTKQPVVAITASIFYTANIYTITQVWMRFIYIQFALWAYLPLFLYLWISWVQSGKMKFLISFLISSIVYSYVYYAPTAIFALWIPPVIFSFSEVIKKRSIKFVFSRTLIGMVLWLVLSVWWLYPLLTIGLNSYKPLLNTTSNFSALKELSNYFTIKDILLLRQKFILTNGGIVGFFYNNPNTFYWSLLVVLLGVVGFIYSLIKKNYYLILLFLVSLFLIKGANPPMGKEFYEYVFSNVPSLQIFRNPYEKLGVIFLIPYSIFFALGIVFISKKAKTLRSVVFSILFGITVIALPWPFWKGYMFLSHYVLIPPYYSHANEIIKTESDGAILQMPYLRGASIEYDWFYKGEETSSTLFSNNSISRTYNVGSSDQFYDLLPKYFDRVNFPNLLAKSGIGFVILHDDIIKSGYHQEWVDQTKTLLRKWNSLENISKVGKLDIYKINSYKGQIYTANKIVETDSMDGIAEKIVSEDPINYNFYVFKNSGLPTLYANNLPDLKYEKISNSRYKIIITNSSGPYVLILTQSYNDKWYAKINNDILSKHFVVNGFANGWYVDKVGDYTIDLVFKIWPWD